MEQLVGVLTDHEEFLELIDVLEPRRAQKVFRDRENHFIKWNDKEFIRRFRLSKDAVRFLLNHIRDRISSVTESRQLSTFTVLCEKYQLSIKRDPCYVEYLDKIGQIFFGVKPPPQQSRGLFDNFFQSILHGLDDDSDTDTTIQQQQASTSTTTLVQPVELD